MEDVEIELGLRKERSAPRSYHWTFEEAVPHPDALGNDPASLPVRKGKKIGRNDPCPCGSGKKYKKCCLN
jgi:preprotein translocase subunit SecA